MSSPLLIRLLSDDDVAVQANACQALGGLGKDAPAEARQRADRTEPGQGRERGRQGDRPGGAGRDQEARMK